MQYASVVFHYMFWNVIYFCKGKAAFLASLLQSSVSFLFYLFFLVEKFFFYIIHDFTVTCEFINITQSLDLLIYLFFGMILKVSNAMHAGSFSFHQVTAHVK